jgi:hypothetical protein
MGMSFLSRVQGKGKDHAREVAIWSKGGFEACIL